MNRTVYFLILNYNSSRDTIALFQQLLDQYATWSGLRVLVLDNLSEYADREQLIRSIPSDSLILNEHNTGYAGGNNTGIKVAIRDSIDFVVILNPDIRIEGDFLSSLIKKIERDPGIGAIGPRIYNRDNPDIIYSDAGLVFPTRNYETAHLHFGEHINRCEIDLRDADYVNGSAILLNMKAVNEVGLLNDSFFLYFEEVEWCFRARQAGWKIMVDSSVTVYQQFSANGPAFDYYMNRNRLWLAKIYGNYISTRNEYIKQGFFIIIKWLINWRKRRASHAAQLKGVIDGIRTDPEVNRSQ